MAQDILKLFGKSQIPALEFCQLHQELPSTEGKYNDPTGFSDWQMKCKLLQKNTGKTISFKHTQLVGANLISKAYCSLRHLIYLVRCIITKKTKSKKHC